MFSDSDTLARGADEISKLSKRGVVRVGGFPTARMSVNRERALAGRTTSDRTPSELATSAL